MLTLWAYLAAQTVKESACDTGDPWVRKIPLEKGIATHSSILAWRVPWQAPVCEAAKNQHD